MSGSKQGRSPTVSGDTAGGEKYLVEKLVGKRITAGKVEYRVKWLGWESKHNTWESHETMNEDCPLLVLAFEEDAKKLKRAAKQSEEERHGLAVAAALHAENEQRERQADSVEARSNDDERGEKRRDSENEDSAGNELEKLEDNHAPKKQAKTNGDSSAVPVAPLQKKKVNKKRTSKKRRSRKTQVQAEPKPKYIPERILGVTQGANNQLQFLIKWKDMPVANVVPASRANIGCPQLVINWYESRLCWREGEERMQLVQSEMDDESGSEEANKDSEDGHNSDFDWQIVA